jgi:prevent-host-death family protein
MHLSAAHFKAHCLRLMDDVQKFHTEIVITKRGKPVARLVPVVPRGAKVLFGAMKGSVKVKGDIVAPIGESWQAEA